MFETPLYAPKEERLFKIIKLLNIEVHQWSENNARSLQVSACSWRAGSIHLNAESARNHSESEYKLTRKDKGKSFPSDFFF